MSGLQKQLFDTCSVGNLNELLQLKYHNPDEVTDILLGPDLLSEESRDHWDFLHIACKNGHFEIVQNLIEWGADENALSSEMATPLCMACTDGHLDIAKFLVANGATIYSEELGTSSPIVHACLAGQAHVVEFLLSERPVLLQTLGQLMFYMACKEGHLDIVELLVKKGVEINPPPIVLMSGYARHGTIPGIPLEGACQGRQIAVMQYLIENGARVTTEIVERFWELLEEVLVRSTHALSRGKKKTSVSFEVDPSVPLLEAIWCKWSLYALHKAWVINLSARLVSIDLSENNIRELPEELLNDMPVLEVLDVSHNELTSLPDIYASSFMKALHKVSFAHNHLTYVPATLFQVKTLKRLNLSHNHITSLAGEYVEPGDDDTDSDTWTCTSLKILQLSNNALQHLPAGIYGSTSLVKLFVDHNNLKDFPTPWKCPLETLDLSNNSLTEFLCNVEMVWSESLQQLNLSYNRLEEISWNVCQLSLLRDLDFSHNVLKRLPVTSFWKCSNLRKLDLGHNKLAAKSQPLATVKRLKVNPLRRTPSQDEGPKTDCELPAALLTHTLEILHLNNNSLQTLPASVCKLTNLIELNLSNNTDLRTLPSELGNLVDCYHLGLQNLNLKYLPKRARPGEAGVRAKDTLAYLKAKLRKSVPYYRMKLMVVGLQGRGKTTLLALLRGHKMPDNISTVGIIVSEWQVQIASGSKFKLTRLFQDESPTVTFSTWDLAGQSVYYPAHQMFLSPNTLYLAVWNVTHGEEGVESLRNWLLNIQARAPGSDVVIVGTHADQLPKDIRPQREMALKQSIMERYASRGFPNIVSTIFVSSTTGENIAELKETIYSRAVKAKDQSEPIIGRLVPQSYIWLQEAVLQEALRRRTSGEPPILVEDEMLELAKSNQENDIHDSEELTRATRFLHENGILLHYNDQLRGLNHLYFIDPSWVCDLIAALVTVRERNPFVMNGIMKASDVQIVLKDPRFPQQFIPQYLQLTERFEIVLGLDDKHLLIPSMLPRERPGIHFNKLQTLLSKRKVTSEHTKEPATESRENKELSNEDEDEDVKTVNSIRRLYQMMYIPSGFWSRLITRLLVSTQRWRNIEGIGDDSYSSIYWREGLGVVYDGGHFLIQSYSDLAPLQAGVRRERQEGISISVWSSSGDFSSMGFIVDQIDALISEWYPGLDETDKFGLPLVRRLIPCPRCELPRTSTRTASLRRTTSMDIFPASSTDHSEVLLNHPFFFTLPTCAAVALSFSSIACPRHVDQPVPLKEIIPDLMLTDLPKQLLIRSAELQFQTTDSSRLGSGGAGEVYRGTYRKDPIAVKTFHSFRNTGHVLDSGLGGTSLPRFDSTHGSCFHGGCITEGSSIRRKDMFQMTVQEESIEEELEKTKIVRAFWDLRQEVSMLCRLHHPCVVTLLGVCLHPLCFVLELAPHGSLASVLEDALLNRDTEDVQGGGMPSKETRECPLGRGLSYKIAHQVASAVWYLHDCDIIYRDLKADNVLVWSLDETSLLNVKVSDYGISCFATPQGVAGEEGTPGYQAPEIRTGIGYDEKVDIFSFGILLFEILSGSRPFFSYRSAVDIKKAIRRGERPRLDNCNTSLPRLEHLMRSCWHQLPEHRPSAEQIIKEMSEPSFLCQCRLMPSPEDGTLEKVTAVLGLSHSGNLADKECSSLNFSSNFVLVWSRKNEHRNYSLVNCNTGEFCAFQQPCRGHRVLCMSRVGNRTWLGTEGNTIDVFGRKAWGLPTTLWSYRTKAVVLALLAEETMSTSEASASHAKVERTVKRVFASLGNGTLVAISRQTKNSEIRSHDDVIRELPEDEGMMTESCEWSDTTVVNLGQKGKPAMSLVIVNGGRELWIGCGNNIVVVDCKTLAVVDEICVYQSQRTHVRVMVSDGENVWSADRRSTRLLQWNVQTRKLTHIFNCDVSGAAREVICNEIRKHSAGDDEKDVASSTNDEESAHETYSAEAVTSLDNNDDNDFSQEIQPHGCTSSEETTRSAGSRAGDEAKEDGPDGWRTPPMPIPGNRFASDQMAGSAADSGIVTDGNFFPAGVPSTQVTEENSDDPEPEFTDSTSGYELVNSVEARAAAIQAKRIDSSLSSGASKKIASMKTLGSQLKALTRGPSLMGPRKRKSERRQAPPNSPKKPWPAQPRLRFDVKSVNRVTALLLVEGTLWVGRGTGDILAVNVESEKQNGACPYGQVMAQLHSDNFLDYVNGPVDDIVHTGGNKVICCRRLEVGRARSPTDHGPRVDPFGKSPPRLEADDRFTERYQLIEWEAWGVREFQQFKTQMEAFNKLVD